MIVSLDDPACAADVVGSKAAALGRLSRAGLPVPRGFAVPAQASEGYLREAGVTREVERFFETAESAGDWRRQAIVLRAALAAAPLPDDVAKWLRAASQRLHWPLAVRSSALVEDHAGATFAGVFTTLLGITTFDNLVSAVRSCWASRFSDTAIRYALGRGIDLRTMNMAVILQEVIEARSAGSALSRDPAGTITLTAAWGLGRAVTDGQVVPDWWRVDRQDLTVRERHIGTKPLAARLDPAGGEVWRRQTHRRAVTACLDEATVSRVAALVLQAEHVFRAPREVEWATDRRRRPWLLQARPLTPAQLHDSHSEPEEVVAWFHRGSALEGQPTSPGRVFGRARHLVNAARGHPGDILVARALPPGITAIVPQVAGLIVEAGGSTAHAATLARERGIPAIFGAIGATDAIREGALVLVDGSAGRVWYQPA